MDVLTKENASRVSTVTARDHPDWGPRRFNHNSVQLCDGDKASSFGSGSNSAIIFEKEFKFWFVASYKES